MYLKKSKCFSLLIGVIITLLLCFSSVAGAGVTNGPENPPVQSQQVSVVESTYPEAQGKSEIEKLQEEIYKKGFTFKVKDNWITELSPEERKTLFGFIPPKAPAQLPAGMGFINLKQKAGMYGAEALPSKYDAMALSYVTPIKNQANCGSCWIFGAVADLESDVLIKENKTFDFSEQEVGDCHFWQRVADRSFCKGGNSLWTTDYFTQYGSALESCHPYKAAPDGCKNCPLIKNVTNGRFITFNDGEGQIEAIKAAILNYGPVQSCLYAGDPAFGAYDGGVYEYWEPEDTNHLIQIIGWDDSLKHSQGTGAWLIKNSWSTKWGAHGPYPGCGWVAYKSANLGDFTFAISDYKEARDTIYYHDEGGFVGTAAGCNKPTAWGAVRFIPAKDASLNAVDFWTPDVNMNYEIKIFDQINQGYTLSNQLGVTQTGSTKEVGYYSLPLTKPIPLQKGNDFIVQVKFTTTTGYPYPVPVDYDNGDLWSGNVKFSGESYFSCDGNKFEKACFDDLCLDLSIRARATENLVGTEVKVADVAASPNAAVEVPVNIKNVVKLAGAMLELSYDPAVAVATAVKKGDFVGDFLMEANLKEADKGKIIIGMMGVKGVTGSGDLCKITFKTGPKGKTTLEIKALGLNDEDGTEIPAKGINGSITIEEKPKLAKLELSGALPTCFKVGDTFDLKKLTLKGYDQYGKPYDLTNKPVKWASSNTGVAVIVDESILKAVGAGKTKVTATVEEVTSNPLEFRVCATFIIAGKKSGSPGGNTTVPINIKNAAGMAGTQFELNYDPKVAVATEAKPGDLVKDFQFTVNFNEAANGKIIVALAGTKGVTGDGELCLITFSLKGKVGDSTKLSIKDLLLNDEKGAEIPACPEDGEIKISLICGDVNNDKRVTAADATLTLRAAVGLEKLTYEQICAANVNCDKRITAADVTLILRYAVGLDKELKCCCIDG